MITIPQADIVGAEIMNHKLTHIDREASVLDASKLMRKAGTTELLVTDKSQGKLSPLGVVTATDIVTRVMAAELDPTVMTTGDIAESAIPVSDIVDSDAAQIGRPPALNAEALAVLDDEGRLVGTVRLDEIKGGYVHMQGTP